MYFRAVRGGSVELFNDAHSGLIPHFPEGKGLFPMIENDLREAREYIYITGYSFWPEIVLNREKNDLSFGQILKQKDAEGVEIKLLLWKESLPWFNFSEVNEATVR